LRYCASASVTSFACRSVPPSAVAALPPTAADLLATIKTIKKIIAQRSRRIATSAIDLSTQRPNPYAQAM